jgi:hypothetical protein
VQRAVDAAVQRDREQLAALRKQLKAWEQGFERDNGRRPSGSDDIPFHIREDYREYANLKERVRNAS